MRVTGRRKEEDRVLEEASKDKGKYIASPYACQRHVSSIKWRLLRQEASAPDAQRARLRVHQQESRAVACPIQAARLVIILTCSRVVRRRQVAERLARRALVERQDAVVAAELCAGEGVIHGKDFP